MKVGDKVKLTRKHYKEYYSNLDYLYDINKVNGKVNENGVRDIVEAVIACRGIGTIININSEGDPSILFVDTLGSKKYRYVAYFERKQVRVNRNKKE